MTPIGYFSRLSVKFYIGKYTSLTYEVKMSPFGSKMNSHYHRTSGRAQISPHMVSVLIAIKSFSERDRPHPPKLTIGSESTPVPAYVRWSVLERRHFAKAALSWVQGFDEDHKTFETKVRKISSVLSDLLTQRLKDITESEPLKLADFFESMAKLLDSRNGEAPLHRQSILGMFVRRMVLTYDKLTFSETMKLYRDLKGYLQCPASASPEKHPEVAAEVSGMDISIELDETPMLTEELEISKKQSKKSTAQTLSQKQAESFISEQAALLQNEDPTAPPPDVLQEQIGTVCERNPHLAEVHYLTFLNCLRLNEFCGAVHSLHKYFDQLTQKKTRSNESESMNANEEWTHSFRYAALNMASLHFRLGHTNEAVLALREAIQKAQEANDHVCLQHAMSWMYRMSPDEEVDLGHTIAKSEELNLPYLTSLGVQTLAKQKALTFVKPFEIFEYLSRSDALNCQHQQQQLVSVSQAQQSSLWNIYGYRFMSSLCDHFLLNSVTSEPSRSSSNQIPDTESFCLTVCHQARLHFNAGELDVARDLIQCAKESLSTLTEHSKIWMQCEQEFAFQHSILQGKFSEAKKAVENLSAINQSETTYCNCILLAMQGKVTMATEILCNLIQKCHKEVSEHSIEFHAKCLLLLSSIYLMQGEPTSAIPHLLECVALCQQHYQAYMLAVSTAHVAYAQFLMKMPEKALALLEEVLPQVLANGSLYTQCCVQFLVVQCRCQVTRTDEDRKSAFLQAAQLLNQVMDGFQRLGAEYKSKDVVYYQAHLYQQTGYTPERNKCALHFRSLERLYPTNRFPPMKVLWPLLL
ncbi:anaphase-promoting complex subunit 5-like [Apostichopus japonicus]|uniref:anaphase-promoting complex subunit 5-like n=1 Tax=Stichopus japonicus TaxID=307972 RepID=UPI003AB66D68